jgi:hypothetical protein
MYSFLLIVCILNQFVLYKWRKKVGDKWDSFEKKYTYYFSWIVTVLMEFLFIIEILK